MGFLNFGGLLKNLGITLLIVAAVGMVALGISCNQAAKRTTVADTTSVDSTVVDSAFLESEFDPNSR